MKPNILLDALPDAVKVDGRAFFVDADFRNFIRFEQTMKDTEMDNAKKVLLTLERFYGENIPHDVAGAFHAILWLYQLGEDVETKKKRVVKNGDVELRPKMIYDFDFDAPYIFSAFLTQYGVDLNEIPFLHWWKFHAMFQGLGEDIKICQIMSYRATDLGKIKDQKERSRIAKLKRIYALPQNLTYEEKVAQAGAAFGGFM